MKRNGKWLAAVATLIALALALGLAGTVGAHGSKTEAGIKFTFGGSDEPVITGMRTWLELKAADETTAEPVSGLAENDALTITVSNGEWSRTATMSESRGNPGLYRAAFWFITPGKYDVSFKGTAADATPFAPTFHKDVADHEELFFPAE